MLTVSFDAAGLDRAMEAFTAQLPQNVHDAFEMTLESIVVRAKATNTFVDRTGALRNSIRSDGVEGSLDSPHGLVGSVSYAATSEKTRRRSRSTGRRRTTGGKFYGVFLEYGTRYIKERRFIRDAIDAEDGDLIQDAIAATFRDAGFAVRG